MKTRKMLSIGLCRKVLPIRSGTAMADQIKIEIRRVYNKLQICIADNGIGCEEVKKGFGLHHMEERIQMLQGSLEYESKNGFTVRVELPIRWGQEE